MGQVDGAQILDAERRPGHVHVIGRGVDVAGEGLVLALLRREDQGQFVGRAQYETEGDAGEELREECVCVGLTLGERGKPGHIVKIHLDDQVVERVVR